MGILTHWVRARRWLGRQLVGARPPLLEDPELLLQQAQEEMRTMHAKNRERAVQAITQKNILQHMVKDTDARINKLHEQMQLARSNGDEVRASQLMQQMQCYQNALDLGRKQLEIAEVTCDQVKAAIRREDEKIRQKTAEALTLRMQWKLVKIEQALTISLAQISANRLDAGMPRDEIRLRHQRSRELVVEAFAHKSSLEQIASETRTKAEKLRAMTEVARRRGDEDVERGLLREMEQHEAVLASTDAALLQAIQVTDRARQLLDDETQRFQAMQIVDPLVYSRGTDGRDVHDEQARRRASFRRTMAFSALFAIVALLVSLWPS